MYRRGHKVRYYDSPTKARFWVMVVTGWPIIPGSSWYVGGGGRVPGAMYAVCDRLYNHMEVGTFDSRYGGHAVARHRADALAAKLNAEYEEELASE